MTPRRQRAERVATASSERPIGVAALEATPVASTDGDER